MIEEWRDCPNHFGYRVSNLGRVSGPRKPIIKDHKGDTYGHRQVNMYIDGKQVREYVHTLVLEAFVGPRPDGAECLHADNDPSNNVLSNLSWGTHAINMRSTCKLTEEQVKIIRTTKVFATKLAKRFGVHVDVIKRCRRGETYSWIQL